MLNWDLIKVIIATVAGLAIMGYGLVALFDKQGKSDYERGMSKLFKVFVVVTIVAVGTGLPIFVGWVTGFWATLGVGA